MRSIRESIRRSVWHRAQNRCEYCGLAQTGQEASFHIDHVIPVSAGGRTVADNLSLACVSCSLRKGARLTAPDPATGNETPLFNPRKDEWAAHFAWEGVVIKGTSPPGRATVQALRMNRPLILAIRREEALKGRFPWPELHGDSTGPIV